ncbi:sulfite exporter TauE/SafE family protein [Lapillicoccus sp.]|uniref:sulfite exporter TauE/SafE family protein n=1 Tax=Lapillicoccus sp. TaxID=1909287 RepID=UPI003262E322
MSVLELVAILAAGFAAGVINTIVGSGSLITFPTLLVLGIPPLTANVSNNIGLVPGGVSGALGYRPEMRGHSRALLRFVPISLVGSVIGASLLLVLPAAAFKAIVPVLILLALVLVLAGPQLQRRGAARRARELAPQAAGADPSNASDAVSLADEAPVGRGRLAAVSVGVLVAGMYGGYFGAAQGVLLMGIFSALLTDPIQRLNGYKNVLALVVNSVAALTFVLFARDSIDWRVVLLIGVGSLLGGVVGARVGRRIPAGVLRGLIIFIGVVAIVKLVFFP